MNRASIPVLGKVRYRTKPRQKDAPAKYKMRARVHIRPHGFRHLRAQDLVDEGMPLESVQALLGHADISTTRTIYASRTKAEVLLDQMRTYGRDATEVARTGRAVAQREGVDGQAEKGEKESGRKA